MLKNNTNVASNTINQNTSTTGERPTLQQKLRSFTSKLSRSRSKSPTRKTSKTNQKSQSNEIAALTAEIEELKKKQKTAKAEKLKLTRNLTVLQKISKQLHIQKTYNRPPKEPTGKSRVTECYNIY